MMMENLITSDPEILGGKPIIRGTRISVEFLLKLIKAQTPVEEILDDYPSITRDVLDQFLRLASIFQKELCDVDLTTYFQEKRLDQ
jgi:uncharacterized protein (DUF433 family)